jgi:transcriptional regulator with XRE-family HTH domain
METLADRIITRRRELGLQQSHLADIAGVSESAVSQWEKGKTKNLKLEHLFAIADALKVHARWLALGQGPRFVRSAILFVLSIPPLLALHEAACVLCQIARRQITCAFPHNSVSLATVR